MQLERDISDLAGVIRKQREIAQDALDEARKIDELLRTETDPQKKQDLERIKKGVATIARYLVENTQATSAVVRFDDQLDRGANSKIMDDIDELQAELSQLQSKER
jgi:methionine synthase II (cobalamin-independent)